MSRRCSGVYWIGPVYDMGGYGNVSRNYLRALEEACIPVFITANSAIKHSHEIGIKTMDWLAHLSTAHIGSNPVCIQHGLPHFFSLYAPSVPVTKKIGISLFETDRVPDNWPAACQTMDEIWVPTRFNYETFSASKIACEKLRILPYAIDPKHFYSGRPFRFFPFNPPLNHFTFLYVSGFDYRKNIDLLITAFCKQFSREEKVALVIKIFIPSGYQKSTVQEFIHTYLPKERLLQIRVLEGAFSSEKLLDLYQSCDAYISVDRAGWGMPAMEMMALGKPVIALDWGGYTEFMNKSNSFLIATEANLVPVDKRLQEKRPQFYGSHKWTDLKEDKIGQAMRFLFENPIKRQQLAVKGAYDMRTHFSPAVIGKKIKRLLGFEN